MTGEESEELGRHTSHLKRIAVIDVLGRGLLFLEIPPLYVKCLDILSVDNQFRLKTKEKLSVGHTACGSPVCDFCF